MLKISDRLSYHVYVSGSRTPDRDAIFRFCFVLGSSLWRNFDKKIHSLQNRPGPGVADAHPYFVCSSPPNNFGKFIRSDCLRGAKKPEANRSGSLYRREHQDKWAVWRELQGGIQIRYLLAWRVLVDTTSVTLSQPQATAWSSHLPAPAGEKNLYSLSSDSFTRSGWGHNILQI